MKRLMGYGLLLMAFFLSGCFKSARVIPYEVDRVDQELKGNRGVLMGKAGDLPEAKKKKTKKMYSLEVELPSKGIDKKERKNREIKGNKGYLVGKKVREEKVEPVKKKRGTKTLKPRESYMKPQIVYQKPLGSGSTVKKEGAVKKTTKEVTAKTYVVKKGDTLQKISSEVYGTTKKWKKIFDANKDTLKDPDKIKVGQKLVIPDLE